MLYPRLVKMMQIDQEATNVFPYGAVPQHVPALQERMKRRRVDVAIREETWNIFKAKHRRWERRKEIMLEDGLMTSLSLSL